MINKCAATNTTLDADGTQSSLQGRLRLKVQANKRLILGFLSQTNLEFVEGESSAGPHSGVVSDGLTMYNWSEKTSYWARGDSFSLFQTSCAPALLLTGLVEPGFDVPEIVGIIRM